MEKWVRVKIKNLVEFGSTLNYRKKYGSNQSYFKDPSKRRDAHSLDLCIVTDEGAQFVNLFGLTVDLVSGNIALGLFPRSNEYIKVGNIKNLISKVWFNSKLFPQSIDLKYIIELMKLDPIYYQDAIEQEIRDSFDLDGSLDDEKFGSISVKYIKKRYRSSGNGEIEYFHNLAKQNRFIYELAYFMIDTSRSLEGVARDYYGNFITEQYDQDISRLQKSSFRDVENARDPNLEALTIRYVAMGIPEVFLSSLKSYGFEIKDRKSIFNKGTMLKTYSDSELIDIGIALSSMFYSRNVMKKELILAYNLMDLLRAVNWDQNIIFSVDCISDLKSKAVWESVLKRFNVYDILKERNLSEKELVFAVNTYRNSVIYRIDWGMCYNRVAKPDQYKMISYSPGHLDNAGKVFEMTLNMLSKNLKIERGR